MIEHNHKVHAAIGRWTNGFLYWWHGVPEPWGLEPHPSHIPDACVDHESSQWHTIFYIQKMEDEFLARFMSDMC